ESGYYALQFRAAVISRDPRNTPDQSQDFSVILTDGTGTSVSTPVSLWSRSLYYPQGQYNPRVFLNDVRIPLAAFAGVNLTDVRSVRFAFDQRAQGAFLMSDLEFADPASLYAGPTGPYVISNTL